MKPERNRAPTPTALDARRKLPFTPQCVLQSLPAQSHGSGATPHGAGETNSWLHRGPPVALYSSTSSSCLLQVTSA